MRKTNMLIFRSKLKKLRYFRKKSLNSYTFSEFCKSKDKLLSSRKPFLILNYPHQILKDIDKYNNNLDKYLSNMLNGLHASNLNISVSQDKFFSGHYNEHNTLSMGFEKFQNYSGDLTLYLAQFPLYQKLHLNDIITQTSNSNEHFIQRRLNLINSQKLKNLKKNYLNIPGFINHIQMINLWYSKKDTISKLHYDSYDNFLYMLDGKKVFHIYHPNDESVKCESVLTDFYNQCKLKRSKKIFKNKYKMRYFCRVKKGNLIYLPQGWFHRVESKGKRIVALNFWFTSIQNVCKSRGKYLLKYLLHEQIESFITNQVNQYLTKSSSLIPKDLINDLLKTRNWESAVHAIMEYKTMSLDIFINLIIKVDMPGLRALLLCFIRKLSMNILLLLNEIQCEILTSKLESVDKKIPLKDAEIIAQETKKIELDGQEEVEHFYQEISSLGNFTLVQNHFINQKKKLREKMAKILLNKMMSSYQIQLQIIDRQFLISQIQKMSIYQTF